MIAPLLAGGLIYLLWRSDSLLMFSWLDAVGCGELLARIRIQVAPVRDFLPGLVLYSLPDAMWVYAYTAHFSGIWIGQSGLLAKLWIGLGWMLAFGGELGQWVGVVPGTFDLADLILITVAALIAVFRIRHSCQVVG